MRLLLKLGTLNERPDQSGGEWAETGERYILKLFRDYCFHQVGAVRRSSRRVAVLFLFFVLFVVCAVRERQRETEKERRCEPLKKVLVFSCFVFGGGGRDVLFAQFFYVMRRFCV